MSDTPTRLQSYVAPHAGAWIETSDRLPCPYPHTSLPTRERGLKLDHGDRGHRPIMSLPTRERGLKRAIEADAGLDPQSLPTRERGLKLAERLSLLIRDEVAPHAGAWIETRPNSYSGSAREVAPHAGAWIETSSHGMVTCFGDRSLPTRERGLKHPDRVIGARNHRSLPTRERGLKHSLGCRLRQSGGRSPRGSVD